MSKIMFKGGYGEHGRSCFILPFDFERYVMLDCGIMDTDPCPYPDIEKEVLKKTEFLFLSHCHKDHTGAFSWLVQQGFSGTLVAAKATLELSAINYSKVICLDGEKSSKVKICPELELYFGKSGHCPGGIWLELITKAGTYFYSGDYQSRPLAYKCDRISGHRAQLAIVDCAHEESDETGDERRDQLEIKIFHRLQEGSPLIMPLPRYGRGIEIGVFLKQRFPGIKIRADRATIDSVRMILEHYGEWIQENARRDAGELLKDLCRCETEEYDVLLLADTHLEKKENQTIVENALRENARVLVTGRVKPGGFCEKLLQEQMAEKISYPHHQSRKDFEELMAENQFEMVFPFHNQTMEMWFGKQVGKKRFCS